MVLAVLMVLLVSTVLTVVCDITHRSAGLGDRSNWLRFSTSGPSRAPPFSQFCH
jgi:hypothetical protein